MKEAVRIAIDELRAAFPSLQVEETEDGGAYVAISDFPFGPGWTPEVGLLRVPVPYNYPDAQIYPFYAPSNLKRANGADDPQGVTRIKWRDEPVTQISIQQKGGWDPNFHTLYLAVWSVKHFLERMS